MASAEVGFITTRRPPSPRSVVRSGRIQDRESAGSHASAATPEAVTPATEIQPAPIQPSKYSTAVAESGLELSTFTRTSAPAGTVTSRGGGPPFPRSSVILAGT